MKIIIFTFIMLLLSGCDKEIQKIYVDANGTEIYKKPIKTFERDIECDSRGYAYYVETTAYDFDIHTPILENGVYGAYLVKCKDIK